MIAERLPKTGREDECDLVIAGSMFTRGVHQFEIIEAKNRAKLDLPQFLRERDEGVKNYAKHRGISVAEVGGIVVIKRRNHGMGDSFVVTTLDDYYGIDANRELWRG